MQRLALQSAYDQCPSETLADSSRLRQIKVAPIPLRHREQSFELFLVSVPKLFLGEATGIVNPTQDYQRANLEASGQTIEFRSQLGAILILLAALRSGVVFNGV